MVKSYIDHRHWRSLAGQAIQSGGRVVRPGIVEWDVSGSCENPRRVSLAALKVDTYGRVYPRERLPPLSGPLAKFNAPVGDIGSGTRWMDYDVRCRKCSACLRAKAQYWRLRALAELAQAPRSWFGTLTFKAEHRARINWAGEAAVRTLAPGEDADRVRRSALANASSKEVTLWIKRVRKESGTALRYLLVCEPHKDGFPHWHVLVHEVAGGKPVRHATLSRQWTAGFSNFKLVETAAPAHYVAKYISKSPVSRVRASVGYGQGATFALSVASSMDSVNTLTHLPAVEREEKAGPSTGPLSPMVGMVTEQNEG